MVGDDGDLNLREGLLFGMGDPLLDILAHTDEAFLKKYDLNPNDAIRADERHTSIYQEMVTRYQVQFIPGGATQNTMRVAQWILQKPYITTFLGCIGNDKFGKILTEKTREVGVNVHFQISDVEATGTCAVIVTAKGSNRSLCTTLGACKMFTKNHLEKPENRALMEKAKYFYISGFFLTSALDSFLEVGKHANFYNKIFATNLAAPFICHLFKESLMKILPFVDILFANQMEVKAFAEEQNFETESVEEIGLKICSLPKVNNNPRLTVITQGPHPVIVVNKGKVTKYPVKQLKDEDIIDTNGAGDAFVGGFLAQYIKGKPIEVGVRCGIFAASEILKQPGCQLPEHVTFPEEFTS